MLRIADLEFPIVSCRLEAYCHDVMVWDIKIECGPRPDGMFHGRGPKLSLSLFETESDAFRHWSGLVPREVSWVEKNDTDATPSGMLHIFEHNPVFECHARCFTQGGKVRLELDGKCDVYFDEKYRTDLDLHVESDVTFHCVWFGRRSEADCRSEIAQHLNPDDFEFTLKDGVSTLTPKVS